MSILFLEIKSHCNLKKSETYYSPFAFPGASRDIGERRVHTVDVVGNITVVTQQQSRFVIPLPTAFTHRTIQTSPAFLQDHLCDLRINK